MRAVIRFITDKKSNEVPHREAEDITIFGVTARNVLSVATILKPHWFADSVLRKQIGYSFLEPLSNDSVAGCRLGLRLSSSEGKQASVAI